MTKILANDGISQAGIDALTAKGFEVITEKVNQEDLINSTKPFDENILFKPEKRLILLDLK